MLGLILLAAGLPCSASREIAVSPEGMSPHEAVRAIRAAKAAGSTAAWTIRVAPGLYSFREPLVLTPADSGAVKAPVRWIADGGEAIFSGGRRIDGWSDDGSGVWSAPVPRTSDGKAIWFQSLFVNGRRAVRARHPESGFFTVDDWTQSAVTNADGKSSTSSVVLSATPSWTC
ncbi:MAG: hypothetical protein IKJ89_05020 [Kiritimatiellae bacterium]|nr:hypothetical protein [Kiritimatiellia bacterium]